MSYILDALKRAEAERERGAVPGLHSQPVAHSAALPAGGVRGTVAWLVAGTSLVLLLLTAVFWFWRESAPQVPVTVATAPVAPSALPALPTPVAPVTVAPATPKLEP